MEGFFGNGGGDTSMQGPQTTATSVALTLSGREGLGMQCPHTEARSRQADHRQAEVPVPRAGPLTMPDPGLVIGGVFAEYVRI